MGTLGVTETTNADHRALVDRVRDSLTVQGIAVFPSPERAAFVLGRLVADST